MYSKQVQGDSSTYSHSKNVNASAQNDNLQLEIKLVLEIHTFYLQLTINYQIHCAKV